MGHNPSAMAAKPVSSLTKTTVPINEVIVPKIRNHTSNIK